MSGCATAENPSSLRGDSARDADDELDADDEEDSAIEDTGGGPLDTAVAEIGAPETGDTGPTDTGPTDTGPVVADSGTCRVVINEIQTGDGSTGTADFVELHNVCSTAAAVGGYRLFYRSAAGTSDISLFTFATGATIPANGYRVIGGSGFTGAKDGTLSSGLAVGGGGVALRNASDTQLDSVGYGSATNAFVETTVAPAPGDSTPPKSIARLPNGKDSNNNALDFVVVNPTPGAANMP